MHSGVISPWSCVARGKQSTFRCISVSFPSAAARRLRATLPTAGSAYREVLQTCVFIFRSLARLFTCASFKDDALTTNVLYSAEWNETV